MRIRIFASLKAMRSLAMRSLLQRASPKISHDATQQSIHTITRSNTHSNTHLKALPAYLLVCALLCYSALQSHVVILAATNVPPTPEPSGGDVGTGIGSNPPP